MGLEIEKKWLWNEHIDFEDFVKEHQLDENYSIISDYYFNDFCRLRVKDGEWFITIKSKGNLIREEFEFKINKNSIDFVPTPLLEKIRYYIKADDGFIYEINKFLNVNTFGYFVTVELEIPSPAIIPTSYPLFCGYDITEEEGFYGYNLYKFMKQNRCRGNRKAEVISFQELVNKYRRR